MTREFRDHENEVQSVGDERELAADHSREAARRTSLAGLEREATKSGPPDVLHTKNGKSGQQIAMDPRDRHDRQSEKAREAGFRGVRAELALMAKSLDASAHQIGVGVRTKDWAHALHWFKNTDVDRRFLAPVRAAPNEIPPEIELLAASLANFKKAAARARREFDDPLFDDDRTERSLQGTLTEIGVRPELLHRPGKPLNQSDAALLENATSAHLHAAFESVRMLETGLASGADPEAALRLLAISVNVASEYMRNRPKSLGAKFQSRIKEIKSAYDPLALKLATFHPEFGSAFLAMQVELEQLLRTRR